MTGSALITTRRLRNKSSQTFHGEVNLTARRDDFRLSTPSVAMEWYTWLLLGVVALVALNWLLRGKRANFRGRTALITGATCGIGLEFARCAVRDGLNVVLVARDAPRLAQVKEELIAMNADVEVRVVSADLSTPGAGEQLHRTVTSQGVSVDVLVNNAGFGTRELFTRVPLDTHQRMMRLNMCTVAELTQLFAADMARRGRGRVLNVSSTAGFQPGQSLPRCGRHRCWSRSRTP